MLKDRGTSECNSVHYPTLNQSHFTHFAILLLFLIQHQIHHRGQMIKAGLMVPGIYSPSKDEWANIGMEASKM